MTRITHLFAALFLVSIVTMGPLSAADAPEAACMHVSDHAHSQTAQPVVNHLSANCVRARELAGGVAGTVIGAVPGHAYWLGDGSNRSCSALRDAEVVVAEACAPYVNPPYYVVESAGRCLSVWGETNGSGGLQEDPETGVPDTLLFASCTPTVNP